MHVLPSVVDTGTRLLAHWQVAPCCGNVVKVLHMVHASKPYGSQLQVFDLVKASDEIEVEPTVLATGMGPFTEMLESHSVRVIGPDQSRNWLNNRGRFQWYRKWLINRRLVSKWAGHEAVQEADIVHSHSIIRPFGAMIAEAAQKPHVWHFHEQAMPHLERPFLKSTSWVRNWIQARTTKAVVPSESLRKWASKYIEEDKIAVVANGLVGDAGEFPNTRPLSRTLRPLKIAVVGRMGESKGTHDAIRTLGFLRTAGVDAEVRFVGDAKPEVKREIGRLAGSLGVGKNIFFAGYQTNVGKELARCDIVLMPSHYEAFGRVTVEAMAAGRPVVATAAGGTLDIVQDGVTGLLREPRKPEELAGAILWLLDHPCEAEEMREEAWRSAYENYSRIDFAMKIREVYDDVLNFSRSV